MAARPDHAALQALMAEMRAEYARKLPQRLALIESLWRETASGQSRSGELLHAVHAIAGAATTFGLPEVGRAALGLELAVQPLHAQGGSASEAERKRIDEGVARLMAASRQPTST